MYIELRSDDSRIARVISSSTRSREHTMNRAPMTMPIIAMSLPRSGPVGQKWKCVEIDKDADSQCRDKRAPANRLEFVWEKKIFHNHCIFWCVDFVDTAKVNKVFQKDKYILHFVCCYVQKTPAAIAVAGAGVWRLLYLFNACQARVEEAFQHGIGAITFVADHVAEH